MIAFGLCWASHPVPTLKDYKNQVIYKIGNGPFSIVISGLNENSRYYVRTYEITSSDTSYGEQISFSTLNTVKPIVEKTDSISKKNRIVKNKEILQDNLHVPYNKQTEKTDTTAKRENIKSDTLMIKKESKAIDYCLPLVSTTNVIAISTTSAEVSGSIEEDCRNEIDEKGMIIGTSPDPSFSTNNKFLSSGDKVFLCIITGLKPNTLYYVKAFAKSKKGCVFGKDLNFTTSCNLPSLQVKTTDNTTAFEASVLVRIIDDGGAPVTESGIVYSISSNPTLSDKKIITSGPLFNTKISNLTPVTKYYIKAYATNLKGTAFSDEIIIVTSYTLPKVSTDELSMITGTSVNSGGSIIFDGGNTIIAKGLCCSKKQEPNLKSEYIVADSSENSFFKNTIKRLKPYTTYYIRAYATNAAGTSYGNEQKCTTEKAENWVSMSNFHGSERNLSACFSINLKGYIGTGCNEANEPYKDFWEFDPVENTWTQKADFAGKERDGAIGFSIGNKGYIGLGFNYLENSTFTDLWEYNPEVNAWTKKADFPGKERESVISFSIGNKGYVGLGSYFDMLDKIWRFYNDFWEYDPLTDSWVPKAEFPGSARAKAVCFSIGNKGYTGTGYSGKNKDMDDFWEYDQTLNKWKRKADFAGEARDGAVGFSIGNRGYIGTGKNLKDFWAYDPVLNKWIKKADFEGTGRENAVGFSIGEKGYIGTGYDWMCRNDFWEYTPIEYFDNN